MNNEAWIGYALIRLGIVDKVFTLAGKAPAIFVRYSRGHLWWWRRGVIVIQENVNQMGTWD
jgi:hypothetical protein